mgnify:CR=1 FL=1
MIHHLNLYLDMDGVVADLDAHFTSIYGVVFRDLEEEDAWSKLIAVNDFWVDLPKMPDADVLLEGILPQYNPVFLSSPGSHDEKRARLQKPEWLRRNVNGKVPLLLRRRSEKQVYANPHSVLIDDWEETVLEWRARGGLGIHHTSAETSLKELAKLEDCDYLKWLSSK